MEFFFLSPGNIDLLVITQYNFIFIKIVRSYPGCIYKMGTMDPDKAFTGKHAFHLLQYFTYQHLTAIAQDQPAVAAHRFHPYNRVDVHHGKTSVVRDHYGVIN